MEQLSLSRQAYHHSRTIPAAALPVEATKVTAARAQEELKSTLEQERPPNVPAGCAVVIGVCLWRAIGCPVRPPSLPTILPTCPSQTLEMVALYGPLWRPEAHRRLGQARLKTASEPTLACPARVSHAGLAILSAARTCRTRRRGRRHSEALVARSAPESPSTSELGRDVGRRSPCLQIDDVEEHAYAEHDHEDIGSAFRR
jgi:hypothetical protein